MIQPDKRIVEYKDVWDKPVLGEDLEEMMRNRYLLNGYVKKIKFQEENEY